MKTNVIIMNHPMGDLIVNQRTSDEMFNATSLLNQWNASSSTKKQITDFYRLSSTKIILNNLITNEVKYTNLIDIIRGNNTKNGRTSNIVWMRKDIINDFKLWLSNSPNRNLNHQRREFSFGEEIIKNLFSDYKIIKQFPISNGKYYIDWYIPELNLAIEFDEEHHKYNKNDILRENEIKKEIDCKFLRYNDKLVINEK